MHEFSAIQALIRDACAELSAGAQVQRLIIVVGEASGHDVAHLRAHFDEASRGTPAEGATLQFVREKLTACCSACGTEFVPEGLLLACTHCGGAELVIRGGDSVRVKAVEAL
jgi:hydrogenase nickel incorporation protein HypA/HybF